MPSHINIGSLSLTLVGAAFLLACGGPDLTGTPEELAFLAFLDGI